MSDEANRWTRQRKAVAKAAKVTYRATRVAPSYMDVSVSSIPYLAGPGDVPAPRSFSTPGIHASPLLAYSPVPPAPAIPSHAQLEYPWLLGRPVPLTNDLPTAAVHSAMTDEEIYDADEASAYATCTATPVSSTESPASPSDRMPVTPWDKPLLNTLPHNTLPHNTLRHTSNQALFQAPSGLTYTPQPSPFSPSPLSWATYPKSPILCAGQAVQHNHPQQLNQPLLGLGIGHAYAPACYSSPLSNEYLPVFGHWPQHDEHSAYLQTRPRTNVQSSSLDSSRDELLTLDKTILLSQ